MLVVLFTVLAAPLIQHYFPFITSGPLYGFNADAPDEVFNWDKWWDGSYQEKKGRYLNDHIGFRADLIRLNNQLDYSLLNKLHSWKVVEGKDHYLFMDTYINGYYGRDYVGYTAILEKLVKLKALSDTFERLGKSLILIHAPAKEFMYPENIILLNRSICNRINNIKIPE